MDYINRDERAINTHCEAIERAEIQIEHLPPQKTPRWARQVTARPVGTKLGNGNYMRMPARSQ